MDILLIFLLTIVASFIQRTTGFGFGIFMMTMLPFLMPSYAEATTLSGLLSITTSLFVTIKMWRLISWKRLWLILLTFIVISAVCIRVLAHIGGSSFRPVLGGILIAASLYFLFLNSKINIRPTKLSQLVTGSISGAMGGFFGMQGPPAVLYFISSEPDRDRYMAIVSAYFVFGNTAMTLVRAGNGFLTSLVVKYFAICIIAVALGVFLGNIASKHIPVKVFRKVVYGYIGVSGMIVILTTLLK